MKQFTVSIYNGSTYRKGTVYAENYDEACWATGVHSLPASHIWSIEPAAEPLTHAGSITATIAIKHSQKMR